MALLEVNNLGVSFVTRNGTNKAVDDISFTVESGRSPPSSANPAPVNRWPATACWA